MRELIAILLIYTSLLLSGCTNDVDTKEIIPDPPTELEQFFIDACELARDKEIIHTMNDEPYLNTSEYSRFIEDYLEEQTGENIYHVHDMFTGSHYSTSEEKVYEYGEYIITIVKFQSKGHIKIQNTETNETIILQARKCSIYANHDKYIYGSYTNESTGKYITYQINEETMTHYYEEIINEK